MLDVDDVVAFMMPPESSKERDDNQSGTFIPWPKYHIVEWPKHHIVSHVTHHASYNDEDFIILSIMLVD